MPTKAKAITLPSCAATAALCRSLKPRVMAFVLTARTATAVAAAIETTVNRLAGAEAAQNSSGIARQTAALADLNQRLTAAEAARAKAGTALSDTLKAAGITVSLTEEQHATAVAAVLARLKKDGVDTDALASKPGVSFKTSGVDVLALL